MSTQVARITMAITAMPNVLAFDLFAFDVVDGAMTFAFRRAVTIGL